MKEAAVKSAHSFELGRVSVVSGALQHMSIPDLTAALAAADVDSVELTVGPSGHLADYSPTAVADVARRFDDAAIAVCGLAATAEWRLNDPGLREVFAIADRLGARFVRVFSPEFDSARPWGDQFEEAARMLGALVNDFSTAAEALVEPAPGSVAPSPELARRLVEMAGEHLGVVYDPGSLIAEGHLEPDLAIAVLGPRLRHVHVKNRALDYVDGAWRSANRPLNGGVVAWPRVLRALVATSYAGLLSIDHLSAAPSVDQLRTDLGDLRQLCSEVDAPDAGGKASHPLLS